ncbi:MAG TPA: class I SAM-dependent methyltransferase [Spirochaetota bacterium]|nr:class I SAM-dependent methyltransferase [Spirochaetota bacterium]HNT11666.1 class I SAM-dependent methyltransferase [Spirochaetota bacterium]
MCQSKNLYRFLDLDFTPPADQFKRKDQLREPDIYYPLDVYMCDSCGLAQLGYVVSPEILYRNDYPYESSTTRTGHAHWASFAKTVVSTFSLGKSDLVVDIGSNVGVLLGEFQRLGTTVCGVDPAANIVMLAYERGIDTICDFFNREAIEKILEQKGHASVITGTNVFAHIDDLDELMRNVSTLLNEKGIFIFEAPYFVNLIKHLEYDTIYHEHLSYLSVKPLIPFFGKFGMEVFTIEQVDIHGGSFRVYIGKKGARPVAPIVAQLLKEEDAMGLYTHELLDRFSRDVQQNRRDLTWLLQKLKHEGKSIVGVSAPAKGQTLLNYCRIGNEILDVVTEKSTLKIGRFTPGTHIPVVADSYLMEKQPDYALLLAWNFADEIINNLDAYVKKGGKFIIPIPTPKIV